MYGTKCIAKNGKELLTNNHIIRVIILHEHTQQTVTLHWYIQ